MNSNELFKSLFNDYDNYREKKLNPDFINHELIKELITKMQINNLFRVGKLGESLDGKEIFSIVFGEGEIKILAWSQMHGDEPTATAALFDLFNFFSANDKYDDFRNTLLKKITFHFIPMVNPDGAEMFTRENAYNIDLNRDALRLQSDESKILWDYAEKLEPEFGFNLHDQNSYYTAGRSNNASAISLLAPPMNHVKSINYIREKSMQVICRISETLSQFIPQNIARYKDDFEPRAFGDNFTRNGISTILIESGYYKNDVKKDFIRKLNFTALLSAFKSIAEKDYESIEHKKYFDIPENEELLFDLLLRNLTLNYKGRNFQIDIGINREKKLNKELQSFYYKSKIADLGDLSIFYGIEEHNLNGYQVIPDNKLGIDEPADLKIFFNGQLIKEVRNGFIIEKVK